MNFDFTDYKQYLRQRDFQIFAILVIVGIVGFGAKYFYDLRQAKIQKFAQKTFSESMEVYKNAFALDSSKKITEKEKKGMWEEADIAFRTGYLQNQSSTLAPYFLAYQMQALIKENKYDEAYEILVDAANKIKKNNLFYYLYQTTLALFEIDKKDTQKGLDNLTQLASDKNNPFNDMANFYLGEYYWSINNHEKAKQYFQMIESNSDSKNESPWINSAKEKLKQLD